MKDIEISNSIKYIGVDDKDIDLFESQYIVPNGISYNSYLIEDEKTVLMDTVDKRKTKEWLENLDKALNGKELDYLVISHLEPDHSANIAKIIEKFPNVKLIGNSKTFELLPQFFEINDLDERKIVVAEAEEINIGEHTLQFFMAPMVHWPEVMVTYEKTEKILFSADGFGKFGALDTDEEWDCEARRYYFNIVGKYGAQVQALLKKAATLDIKMICPLHGPVLKENLEHYINQYDTWSSYKPETEGIFIAYASIHGNTADAANELKDILEKNGAPKVAITDLAREDMAEAIEDAFRYNKIILAASSYNFGVFPPMEQFLNILKGKNYQNRVVGIVENGTWAPSAARTMKTILEQMKDIKICEPVVTIKTTLNKDSKKALEELAKNILEA